jgi:hypothetical protein
MTCVLQLLPGGKTVSFVQDDQGRKRSRGPIVPQVLQPARYHKADEAMQRQSNLQTELELGPVARASLAPQIDFVRRS